MVNYQSQDTDTIAAIATASGRGGVGIVRLSGPLALSIGEKILGFTPKPRYAHFSPFHISTASSNDIIDEGIALYFPGPHSFTGEDVIELQGHGGPVVLDRLLKQCFVLGARPARPGEFSERAFLNDKLDLAQAEAIADLIDSNTEQAAKQALHSLQGAFSTRIDSLVEEITQLRIYVEAAMDFPEEEIDFLTDGKVSRQLDSIQHAIKETLSQARVGATVREGIRVVLAGKPNAGKSSLLNALAGKDRAIVTHIPGTTRDILSEEVSIDGVPLHVIDTAGLRESDDPVEQEGIRRAWQAMEDADRILYVVDSTSGLNTADTTWQKLSGQPNFHKKLSLIANKMDLLDTSPPNWQSEIPHFPISAQEATGLNQLRRHLLACVGLHSGTEGAFSARRRHLEALESGERQLNQATQAFLASGAGELLAEDLKAIQNTLGEITGKILPDDLLGRIFSSFCIGK